MFTLEQRLLAKEIFHQMYNVKDHLHKYPMCFDTAKECAVIAIDRIIGTLGDRYLGANQNAFDFYLGAKDYLINLTKTDLENEY
jgi:hypothetical protein